MKNILSRLLKSKTNAPEIAFQFVRLLDVKITASSLKYELERHPDYPSLLSISDVLNSYNVDNLSLQVDPNKLLDVAVPFITQVKSTGMDYFTVVKQVTPTSVTYYDSEKQHWTSLNTSDFLKGWTGILLMAEAGINAGEPEYQKKAKQEKKQQIIQSIMFFWLPVVVIIMCITALINLGDTVLFPLLFTLLSLAGSTISFLLMWYGFDQYNPVLQQICGGGNPKINCSSILQSGGSRIAGISWSNIGFSYFTATLLFQLFWGLADLKSLFFSGWLSILATPYIIYSVYYQWKIAKQWCTLCLMVQCVLFLQSGIAIGVGWLSVVSLTTIGTVDYLQLFTAFALPFMMVSIIFPALLDGKEKVRLQMELLRIKHDPQIFRGLLEKQQPLVASPEGLGIRLGAQDAIFKVIKVCNPYCGPCAKAHAPMEELLQNNINVQLQIIFTATNEEGDIMNAPVKHLMAIHEKGDEGLAKRALHDWYAPEKKDYETFALKHPMNGELKRQDHKITAMNIWCKQTMIAFTPTFFVSMPCVQGAIDCYYKLPDIYDIKDLKYLLSV